MLGFIGICLFTLFFGFLAAAIIHKVLHGFFRFRSAWNTTYVACAMTVLVCVCAFFASLGLYDKTSSDFFLEALGTTALASLITGTLACRLIIRSESGRQLPLVGAAFLSFVLTAPPVFCGMVLNFIVDK